MSASNTAVQNVSGESGGQAPRQVLVFTLDGENYAIDILHIREIIEYGVMTEVPMMPDTVRGVINLRGAVVPVIDLSARFGGKRTQTGRRTCIIIVEVEYQNRLQILGVMVDAVNEVMDIDEADIEPAPSFGAQIRTDFIQGMGKVKDAFVIILDVAKVFSFNELAQISRLTAGANEALAHDAS
ncbi:MAG: purine-binding chemotaxis protein CheW [Hahellaceae bacterium]|nr:purine-binding chemotaxis protein CheW [Hahellaceae bacterium]MCP5168386.1 purine-binding chemotaxis protein CheW [Hahellaceae bacterium]